MGTKTWPRGVKILVGGENKLSGGVICYGFKDFIIAVNMIIIFLHFGPLLWCCIFLHSVSQMVFWEKWSRCMDLNGTCNEKQQGKIWYENNLVLKMRNGRRKEADKQTYKSDSGEVDVTFETRTNKVWTKSVVLFFCRPPLKLEYYIICFPLIWDESDSEGVFKQGWTKSVVLFFVLPLW